MTAGNMLTLYRLSPEFYQSAGYSVDCESITRIRAAGQCILSAKRLGTISAHCRKAGYCWQAKRFEIFGGYWTDAENVYRIV